ncbi:MAG: hypothetical protein KAI07_04525 [Deltaproteobacteria bacterium]|nr:hypothetical protein [Deltaproteobacteria bacterium]
MVTEEERVKNAALLEQINLKYPHVELNLEVLAEEAAEVIQMKSKCMRFGLQDQHKSREETNCVALALELGDLLAMVDILIANKAIKQEHVQQGYSRKMEKLEKNYAYSLN